MALNRKNDIFIYFTKYEYTRKHNMITQYNDNIISTRYIPDLAYRNDNTSVVVISNYVNKIQFLFDTVTYYAEKDYPVILLGSEVQANCVFSTFSDNDKERLKSLEHITYHNSNVEELFQCINRGYKKFNLHPIIIGISDLPEQKTVEIKELFSFIEKIKPMNIQFYLFSPQYYNYFYDNINNICKLEYYWDHHNEHSIMEINFFDKLVIENCD